MDPNRFSGFAPSVSWSQHQKDISSGHDFVGFRFIEDNHKSTITEPSKFKTRQLDFPSLDTHPFGEKIQRSVENIERISGQTTRDYLLAKKNKDKRRMQKARTSQTEIMGEFSALRRMTQMKRAKPMFPVEPGHGRGIDQMWKHGNNIYIVEAKGPGAKLSKGQMSDQWIHSRLTSQSNSQDSKKRKAADAGLKNYHTVHLKKAVITTKFQPTGFKDSANFKL